MSQSWRWDVPCRMLRLWRGPRGLVRRASTRVPRRRIRVRWPGQRTVWGTRSVGGCPRRGRWRRARAATVDWTWPVAPRAGTEARAPGPSFFEERAGPRRGVLRPTAPRTSNLYPVAPAPYTGFGTSMNSTSNPNRSAMRSPTAWMPHFSVW